MARLTFRERKLDPAIDWLVVANRKKRVGDRIAYRECLRLARVMRIASTENEFWGYAGSTFRRLDRKWSAAHG